MNIEKQVVEIKVKNMTNVSFTIWLIGYLFTIGIADPHGITEVFLLAIGWPLFLGDLAAKLLGL